MRNCNELTAKVSRIKNGRTFVAVTAPDKCEGCKACHIGRLNKSTELPAINGIGAKEGDVVVVGIRVSTSFATLALVLFPLVFFVAGIIIGLAAGFGELAAGGVALAAAAAAFGLTFLLDRTVIGKKYAAKIIEILPGNKESDDDTKEKVQH